MQREISKRNELDSLLNRLKVEAFGEEKAARKVLKRYTAHTIQRILNEPNAFPPDFWKRIKEQIEYEETRPKDRRGRKKITDR